MDSTFDITVVICTYNRAAMLAPAVEGVLRQKTNGVRYEVIVVDNNSSDETRSVIESYITRGATNLRYVLEKNQGLSFARNAGIEHASAPIIAFTDDDVRAEPSWVYEIKQTFDAHPEVAYAGGKVLPLWEREPPAWLTTEHWSPLALSDHGEAEFYVDADRPACMVGANLVVRREVFDKVGRFATEFQRVKDGIGSTEDHEWQLRVWQAGMRGLYAPGLVIAAEVQANRLEKAYHRRWHTGHGSYVALMRIAEYERASWRLLDVPAHLYRQALESFVAWAKENLRSDTDTAFYHETQLRFYYGFVRARIQQRQTHTTTNLEPNKAVET